MIQISLQIKLIAIAICWVTRQGHGEDRRTAGFCNRSNRRAIIGQGIDQPFAIRCQRAIFQRLGNFQNDRIGRSRSILAKINRNRAGYAGRARADRPGCDIPCFAAQCSLIHQAVTADLRAAIGREGDFRSVIPNHQMHRCGICIAIAILQRIGEVVFNILTADIHNVGISGIGPRPIRPNGQRAILGINRDTIDRVNNRADHRAATFRRIGDGRDGGPIGIRPDRVIICQQIAGDRIAGRIPRLIQAVFAIILGIRHIVLNVDFDVALRDRAIAIGRNQGKGNVFDQIGALRGRMVQIAQQVKLIAVAICWIARQRHRENGLCPRQCGNRRSVGRQRIGQGHAIRRETHILQR